jgi:amino acid adenylation domain-containing protein
MKMIVNLTEYLERTVKEFPDRTAIIETDQKISFARLYDRAWGLAQIISDKLGYSNKNLVAVLLPKSVNSIVADIAISLSSNFYMNLDIKSPPARISGILNTNKPTLVISNADSILKLGDLNGDIDYIIIDELQPDVLVEKEKLQKNLDKLIDTDPLCIINTSGSTGVPKGVILNHRSFIDFTEWAIETLEIGNEEIIGSLSPLVFDIYSFELCMLMSRGSTIVLIPENQSAFPVNILKQMQELAVSFIFWVPTIMVNIANMDLLSKIPLPALKTVWFAGEVFPTKQFNYWKRNLTRTKFVNLYGPIEITLDCTYFVVDRDLQDNEPIPIGFPCRNTGILILNDENKIAAVNELGELCIRGSSLAMGYYNNPEKTAYSFVQNPLNTSYPEIIYKTGDMVFVNDRDEIIFKGRKDSLIKHLGYRIELGEIEHVIINTLKLVKNGCVVYNISKKEITLFYESENVIPVAELRTKIGTIFPKYMIPGEYIRTDELPRNTNGKIDRLLLSSRVNEMSHG